MVLQCAETAGIVDTVLAITRDCYSFGRPLASYQAIKHRLHACRGITAGAVDQVAAARDVIAERVLGLPREYAADRGVPFNQVRHNKAQYARRQRR